MLEVHLRPLVDDDLDEVLAANNAEVPAVGELDAAKLQALVGMGRPALVAEVDGRLGGFVVALPPGVPYGSPNYRWLSERYDDFLYVDRVVVLPGVQGLGVGRALYDELVAVADAPVLLAEVNTAPRNDVSLGFHARAGFVPVGEGEPYGDGTRVVYLEKRLRADSAQG